MVRGMRILGDAHQQLIHVYSYQQPILCASESLNQLLFFYDGNSQEYRREFAHFRDSLCDFQVSFPNCFFVLRTRYLVY
jgi:hypothetical protein